MRLLDQLDAYAKRHKIISWVVAIAVVFGLLAIADHIDKENDTALRWQMMASRDST